MDVVEGGHELGGPALQRAVAEHVPRQVPDPGHGEGFRLDVLAQVSEVVLHALPGPARGDPDLLVVVAHAAPGREGVAQPEAVLRGDAVGGVREVGRALVRGYH